jgi:hypothetical protein
MFRNESCPSGATWGGRHQQDLVVDQDIPALVRGSNKIANHQAGTISGVAAVYQRQEFLAERREALDRWRAHVAAIVAEASGELSGKIRKIA